MHQTDACILRAVHAKHYRSIAHPILLCCLAGQLNPGMNTPGFSRRSSAWNGCVCDTRDLPDGHWQVRSGIAAGVATLAATLVSELREFRWAATMTIVEIGDL